MSSVKKKTDSFHHLFPKDLSVQQVQHLLVAGVAPRPIALVSTMSLEGRSNLAPFSFFNAFGSNPPVVAFSPARRGRDGTLKDTYNNLMDTGECVIQIVTYDIVEQVNVTSTEYPSTVDEFEKSGLTKLPSQVVKPYRVAESPFQMECKLMQMIHLGGKNGSGNLAVCEVVAFHIDSKIYTDGKFDFTKMDQVGRNGGAYYTRSFETSMFEIQQPMNRLGVGYENLPKTFKTSHELSANDLGQLATVEVPPSSQESREFSKPFPKKDLLTQAKNFLQQRKPIEAWKLLETHYGTKK